MEGYADLALRSLEAFILEQVRRDGPTLSVHQLAVFLTCYMQDEPPPLRSLASDLRMTRAAASRAAERLAVMGLLLHEPGPDEAGQRPETIARTDAGYRLLDELRSAATAQRTVARRPVAAMDMSLG